jgi:hypothetical protein
MKNNLKLLSISLFLAMIIGTTTSGAFSSVYAGGDKDKNNGDKVKVDCNDVAIALATLYLALGDLDEDAFNTLEDELQEGEIAGSVSDIVGNLQNVLDTVKDKCGDLDFGINFVDFERFK